MVLSRDRLAQTTYTRLFLHSGTHALTIGINSSFLKKNKFHVLEHIFNNVFTEHNDQVQEVKHIYMQLFILFIYVSTEGSGRHATGIDSRQ